MSRSTSGGGGGFGRPSRMVPTVMEDSDEEDDRPFFDPTKEPAGGGDRRSRGAPQVQCKTTCACTHIHNTPASDCL